MNNKKLYTLPLVVTLCLSMAVLSGCGDDNNNNTSSESATVEFDAASFHPLTAGKTYVYKETTPEGEGTIKLAFGSSSTVTGISVPVTPISEILEDASVGEISYYAIDDAKGLLFYGEDDLEAGCEERLAMAFCIPDGLAAGETATQSVEISETGEGCSGAARIDYTVTYEKSETVTVPMGTYENCARIRIKEDVISSGGETLAQDSKVVCFAKGIGMVKEIEFAEAGDETMELTEITSGL